MSELRELEDDARSDRRWSRWAVCGILGTLALAGILGLVVVPVSQGAQAGISAWGSICRAIGIEPGSATAKQTTSTALAAPVSDVAWTPQVLSLIATGNEKRGKAIAEQKCAACHGGEGVSANSDYPLLAGQSAAAIYKQLHDYKSGARAHPLMTPLAQALPERDLLDAAIYFGRNNAYASLLAGYTILGDDKTLELIERGDPARKLAACNSCHGNRVGGPIETPSLVGQQGPYLHRQLEDFAKGTRRNDVFRRMREVSAKLTPAERQKLAIAYQGIL